MKSYEKPYLYSKKCTLTRIQCNLSIRIEQVKMIDSVQSWQERGLTFLFIGKIVMRSLESSSVISIKLTAFTSFDLTILPLGICPRA